MITDNEGTSIDLQNIPVVIDGVSKQVVNLVIKQDGNEVRLRLKDNNSYSFNALEFFNDFIDVLYKEEGQSFSSNYSIQASFTEEL